MKKKTRVLLLATLLTITLPVMAGVQSSYWCKVHERNEVNDSEGRKNHTATTGDPIVAFIKSIFS